MINFAVEYMAKNIFRATAGPPNVVGPGKTVSPSSLLTGLYVHTQTNTCTKTTNIGLYVHTQTNTCTKTTNIYTDDIYTVS